MLEAHDKALEFGGAKGISNSSLVESAIGRPYTGYYRSIYKKAAAITHSLCRNHGFTDGNKRTALLILELFLDRSGYQLIDIPGTELEDAFVNIATGVIDFDTLCDWFKNRIVKLEN